MLYATATAMPTSEVVSGVLFVVGLLLVAYWIGNLLGRVKKKRFANAWRPLVSLVNGTFTCEATISETSVLTGTYAGYPVRAYMAPGSTKSHYSKERYNYFEVQLLHQPGKLDWRIDYQTSVFGLGKQGWQIQAPPALEEQLKQQGVLAPIRALGNPIVKYTQQQQSLLLSEDVTPGWAPGPQHFKQQLELLLYLAKTNRLINAP
jgi:hypothetical protein